MINKLFKYKQNSDFKCLLISHTKYDLPNIIPLLNMQNLPLSYYYVVAVDHLLFQLNNIISGRKLVVE